MKRLIKNVTSSHDFSSRDEAIAIINGKIYVASTHARCINQYLEEQNQQYQFDDLRKRPDGEVLNNLQQIAFAHKVDYTKEIYVEEKSLQNMTIYEAASILKANYPDYSIYNDDLGEDEYEYKLLIAKIKSSL